MASFMGINAENAQNMPEIEQQWAVKASIHAEVYENLLKNCQDTRQLKLTPIDQEIYDHFRRLWPHMHVDVVDIDAMKTPEEKQRWRDYCETYKDKVRDYNYGTLLRLKADEELSEQNSAFVARIQFYAIEIARNREGFNSR